MAANHVQDVSKYREEHESDEQWELKRAFLERWRDEFPEDKLLCLAQVFINMEFLGCRYPSEVMLQVSKMSEEVAKSFRESRQDKLKRTFVLASNAAEDRAKAVKRKARGSKKAEPINFVKEGKSEEEKSAEEPKEKTESEKKRARKRAKQKRRKKLARGEVEQFNVSYNSGVHNNYLQTMQKMDCLDVRLFRPSMFETCYGKLVLIMRPWLSKLQNIIAMCDTCNISREENFENNEYSFHFNDVLVGKAAGNDKGEAKHIAVTQIWNKLSAECISVVMKELICSEGNAITSNDVNTNKMNSDDVFGAPIENNVALKMMRLMGWKGGGLGSDQQGISEPIKPHLQMVKRAGFGSLKPGSFDKKKLRGDAKKLMLRYKKSNTLDIDLVFASDFSKEERIELHTAARICGLQSKSYGSDDERFLVVSKKRDPFSLVRAIVEKGGSTPKYQVFIPATLIHK